MSRVLMHDVLAWVRFPNPGANGLCHAAGQFGDGDGDVNPPVAGLRPRKEHAGGPSSQFGDGDLPSPRLRRASWRPTFAKASAGQAVNPPAAGPRPRKEHAGRPFYWQRIRTLWAWVLVASTAACATVERPVAVPMAEVASEGVEPEAGPSTITTTALQALPKGYTLDERGRRMRVAFDPGNRFRVHAGWHGSAGRDLAELENALELGLGVQLASECEGHEAQCWKLSHDLLDTRVRPGAAGGRHVALTSTLIRGRYVRFARHPSVTLPTSPPMTLPIPFHIGGQFSVGGAELFPQLDASNLSLEVFRGDLLLEFLRRPTRHRSLILGIGFRYVLDLAGDGGSVRTGHTLAPFTAMSAEFHAESGDGLNLLEVSADFAPMWSDFGGWQNWYGVGLQLERVVAAINDLPIRGFVAARYGTRFLPFGSGGAHEGVEVLAGLSWSLVE